VGKAGVDVRRACTLVGRPRSTHYYRTWPAPAIPAQRALRPKPVNALSVEELDHVRELLCDPAFQDKAPAQLYAWLLDHDQYLCSESTMYRVLREKNLSGERRRQATHPAKVKPELVAHAPIGVWSWDIERHEAPRTEWR
jgi:putative transposase